MKVIYTADDFGPSTFINEGIYEMVEKGYIQSVQVLVNQENEENLEQALRKLHACCHGNPIEIGIHLTLTSGKPLYNRDQSTLQEMIDCWGPLIDNDGCFKDFMKFSPRHVDYIPQIKLEFQAQIDRLRSILSRVNAESNLLILKSASGHHNFFQITDELFRCYIEIVQEINHLIPRSPKAKPDKTNKRFFELAMMLLNIEDNNVYRQLVSKRIELFQRNMYHGDPGFHLKTPNYLDIRFYANLGSVGWWGYTEKQIRKRIKLFKKIMDFASTYELNPNREENHKPLVFEMMFHLGKFTDGMKGKSYFELTDGYTGITPKYFDNRLVEAEALRRIFGNPGIEKLPAGSWDECQKIWFEGNY
ncbi:MAG: ChbG/HpnK family deacetylase [Crocinitomicaceae bacterium]|jgi:predicted glycoside hydrolase/deacetylase ChbG (UPF0249 family)|nr:ChbG/HpnK family deacetylase [Crocinitomicaceae bacterium]